MEYKVDFEALQKIHEKYCGQHHECTDCPLGKTKNGLGVTCRSFIWNSKYLPDLYRTVEEWKKTMPTRLTKFLEQFPHAQIDVDGYPKQFCPQSLGIQDCPDGQSCEKCLDKFWNSPI